MNKHFSLLLLAALSFPCYAQQDCATISNSLEYFSASGSAATEREARINALSMLAENISSTVSSKTNMLTTDNSQTYSNASKSTSVLHLKGITYLTCDRSKKNGVTVIAFISKKDLAQSSIDVAAHVRQYLELMEQKEVKGIDFLPEAYIAYLHTYMSPYAIQYDSDSKHISNVRSYLESYLRTYLSNVSISCAGVAENPEYPEQQLTISLLLNGTIGTQMKFMVELPDHGAIGDLDWSNSKMDVIMTPDSRRTKFSGTLSLVPPPVEADLKEIADHIQIGRDVSFDADMSNVIKLDFNSRQQGDELMLTPAVRHLTIRQIEWMSQGRLLSTEQQPRIAASGLTEITMRINGSQELMTTKTLDTPIAYDITSRRSDFAYRAASINVKAIPNYTLLNETPDPTFPEDAIVYVHADMPNLVFRSSMSAIDQQSYNRSASRYEVLVKPVKQILFVEGDGLIEKTMGIVNPQPKDELHFRANTVPAETLISKGLVSINSDPFNASILINDIETVYRTPFTVMIPDGQVKITLRKKYYQSVDTVVRVDSRHSVELSMKLVRQPGYSPTQDITSAEALSYLQGMKRWSYPEPLEMDSTQLAQQNKLQGYQRQTMLLRRNAALGYSTAALGLTFGVYFHWLNRLLYDGSSSGLGSTMSTMGDASYVMGGVGLVVGIINSVKLSKLKKNWSIEPASNTKGSGLAIIYKF